MSLAGTYRALTNYFMHGAHQPPGSIVVLTHEDAERAIAYGTAVLVEAAAAPEAAPEIPAEPTESAEAPEPEPAQPRGKQMPKRFA